MPRGNFAYPLHLAAISGNVEIVEKLLEYSERVDFLNIKQGTPLHRAAEFNHVMVIKLLIKQ